LTCELCTDPDGKPCFPVYGIGPHAHAVAPNAPSGLIMGSTVLLEQVAVGFTPDPDAPGMGTWWCPNCGSGRP